MDKLLGYLFTFLKRTAFYPESIFCGKNTGRLNSNTEAV
jgi:hypothetical protein